MRGSTAVSLLCCPAFILGLCVSVWGNDLDRARALLTSGDRDRARALLDSTLAGTLETGDRGEAMVLRAIATANGEDYESRVRELADLDSSPERLGWIHFTLGQLAYARGSLNAALREFQRTQEYGRVEEGSLWEGLTAFVLGQTAVARDALERAANSGNSAIRLRALMALGDTYRASNDCQEAQSAYRRLREDDRVGAGWWAAATYREAECWNHLQEPDRAVDLLRNILQQTPSAYEAPLARAMLAGLTVTVPPEPAPLPDTGTKTDRPAQELYSVQVGAFGAGDNARSLAAQIRDHGFPAVRVVKGNDALFRVLVGKEVRRERAESLGDSLGTTLGLGYSVVREVSP